MIGKSAQGRCDDLAGRIIDTCRDSGLLLAAAESLTGGLLADAFVRIPGASDVFLGSAVTYDIAAKAAILKVDQDLLSTQGAVHPRVAQEMAEGTARLYTRPGHEDTVIGMATTGVAGPGPDGDDPAGLVYIGLALPVRVMGRRIETGLQSHAYRTYAYELHLDGDREQVRRGTVMRILDQLDRALHSRG